MIARGVVQLVMDSGQGQVLQVRAGGELIDGVERFQPYGFSSNPPVGTETMIMFVGGNRDHPIAFDMRGDAARKEAVTNSQSENGDILIYSAGGQFIRVAANGKIYIDAPENIHINSRGVLRLEGQLGVEVYSPVYIKYDVLGRGKTIFPLASDSYEIGAAPDIPHNVQPPEHPPAPSEIPLY